LPVEAAWPVYDISPYHIAIQSPLSVVVKESANQNPEGININRSTVRFFQNFLKDHKQQSIAPVVQRLLPMIADSPSPITGSKCKPGTLMTF
jgi:hypothetical protein